MQLCVDSQSHISIYINLEPGPSALETVAWWRPKRIRFGHQATVSSADGPGSRLISISRKKFPEACVTPNSACRDHQERSIFFSLVRTQQHTWKKCWLFYSPSLLRQGSRFVGRKLSSPLRSLSTAAVGIYRRISPAVLVSGTRGVPCLDRFGHWWCDFLPGVLSFLPIVVFDVCAGQLQRDVESELQLAEGCSGLLAALPEPARQACLGRRRCSENCGRRKVDHQASYSQD